MDSQALRKRLLAPLVTGGVLSTAIGIVTGIIGPFGSYLNGVLLERIAYWVVCVWVGWLTFSLGLPVLKRWAQRNGIPAALWMPLAVLVLALIPSLVSRSIAVKIWPVVERISLLEWYGQGVVFCAILTIGIAWMTRSHSSAGNGREVVLSSDPRDRLPARLGRDVQCMQMEDHYVRVHTTLGSDLVLMSLSQAIAGLRDLDGIQTHRSWWVARAAVVGIVEDGRNVRLKLAGGLEAPVSRARLGILRQQGWLQYASQGLDRA